MKYFIVLNKWFLFVIFKILKGLFLIGECGFGFFILVVNIFLVLYFFLYLIINLVLIWLSVLVIIIFFIN